MCLKARYYSIHRWGMCMCVCRTASRFRGARQNEPTDCILQSAAIKQSRHVFFFFFCYFNLVLNDVFLFGFAYRFVWFYDACFLLYRTSIYRWNLQFCGKWSSNITSFSIISRNKTEQRPTLTTFSLPTRLRWPKTIKPIHLIPRTISNHSPPFIKANASAFCVLYAKKLAGVAHTYSLRTHRQVKASKLIPGRINASVCEKTFFQTAPSDAGP